MQPINLDASRTELPSLCTADTCAALRDRAAASIVATGPHYPPGYRNNDRALLHDPALAEVLWQALRPRLPELALDGDGRRWQAVGMNARIRVCRYSDGQSFVRHRDGAYFGADGVRSWLTFQLYLDQDFDGGRTRFWGGSASAVVPQTGAAVVFDHRLWHDGEPVTRGTKHVLRSDVLFRPLDPVPASEGHRGYVWRLAPGPDGALTSGRDGTVRRWVDGRCVQTWSGAVGPLVARGRGWVGGTRDGRWVDDRGASWPAHDGAVLDVAPHADGFVSCGADGTVRGWSPTFAPTFVTRVHDGWAWRLWVDGGAVWTAGADGVLARTEDRRTTAVFHHDAALTAVGDRVIGDETGRVLDFGGRELGRHHGRVRVVVRDGGRVLSAGEDDVVRSGCTVVRRHQDFVTDLLVARDGFLSCSYDGTVRATSSTP